MYKKISKPGSKIPKKSLKANVLVLCVDRDNDLGEKTGIEGPVMGRVENLEAAKALLVSDPGESDANCMFGAVKECEDLIKRGVSADVVTLTGDTSVGTISDEEIFRQLEIVLKEYKPEKIVFVSDGAEDEFIMPVVQSKVPIMSVKRIVVRQSVRLESDYYVITTFTKEILSDAKTRLVLLGIPAIILITFAIYGNIAWRFAIGLTGVYLMVKGLQLEGLLEAFAKDVRASIVGGRLSLFLFIISAIFTAVGLYLGYGVYILNASSDAIVSSLLFIEAGLVYFLVAAISFITAKLLLEKGTDRKPFRYLTFYALAFSVYIMSENAISYVTVPGDTLKLVLSMVASFMIIFVALVTERMAFSKAAPYIRQRAEVKNNPKAKRISKRPKIEVL